MVRRTMIFLKMRNSTNIKSLGRFPGLMHRWSPSQCPKSCWFSASPPEATEEVTFKVLGQECGDSESEEDDEKEKEAEQINVAEKDWGIVQGLVCIYNISTCHSNPYHIEPLHIIPFRETPVTAIQTDNDIRLSKCKMTRSFHDHTSSIDCNIKSAHHMTNHPCMIFQNIRMSTRCTSSCHITKYHALWCPSTSLGFGMD